MSETEGPKRLRPKMGRGSWQFGMWAYGAQVVASAFLAANEFTKGLDHGWVLLPFHGVVFAQRWPSPLHAPRTPK